jgi:acetylglutamate kinase
MTEDLQQRANTLIEALPYLREYWGATMVIKYGGAAMTEPALKAMVLQDVVLLRYVGMNPVLVHGGGPEISDMMRRLGKEPVFVRGLRVTDAETMDIVEMVLMGRINQDLVDAVNAAGGRGVGLSGKHGRMLKVTKQTGEVDLGLVGSIEEVDPTLIRTISGQGYVPIIAPIGVGEDGQTYNINADLAAGRIAAALDATKLVVLSDVPGLLGDVRDEKSLVSSLTAAQARQMLASGKIESGMIPKIEACLDALAHGVPRCHLIDGRAPHALLMEIFTKVGIGTMVLP